MMEVAPKTGIKSRLMTISISPLELKLDDRNPRFVILTKHGQDDIRRYLLANEDVSQLADEINRYGNLLPGERIVVIEEMGKYIVIEGNRRTCSIQLLLSRKLIPNLFEHKIPLASKELLENCQKIEVDVLHDRNIALALMAKRHIAGVKQWKPIAKKQFFASSYNDGKGRDIENLSDITGISRSEIISDIRDYKFFIKVYKSYKSKHLKFNIGIIDINIDPFLRLFKAKMSYSTYNKISPFKFFEVEYDEQHNLVGTVDNDIFEEITKIVFEKTIITKEVNTRNILTDIIDIVPFLDKILASRKSQNQDNGLNSDDSGGEQRSEGGANDKPSPKINSSENYGGSKPGGPAPKSFFETISWEGKLDPKNREHQGLLVPVHELYLLSTKQIKSERAYEVFPVATGMILRTAYEQALKLQLIKVDLWGTYCQSLGTKTFPTLSSIEGFIKQGENKTRVFPEEKMLLAFDRIIAMQDRKFLNANVHSPGDMRVTPDALKSIASAGMFFLIHSIIEGL